MKAVLNTTSLDKAARSAKAGGERIVLTDITAKGLQLHASPSGRRAWYLSCRDAFNKPRQFLLGAYPGLGVSEAREEARGLRERVRQGYDPTKDKRRLKGLGDAARVHTLGDLITAYEKNPDVPESWAGLKACVLRVFKPLLNEPLAFVKNVPMFPACSHKNAGIWEHISLRNLLHLFYFYIKCSHVPIFWCVEISFFCKFFFYIKMLAESDLKKNILPLHTQNLGTWEHVDFINIFSNQIWEHLWEQVWEHARKEERHQAALTMLIVSSSRIDFKMT